MKKMTLALATLALAATTITAPMTASASVRNAVRHRQDTKNEWQNLTIGSAALGLIGLVSHNSALTVLGAGGAIYSNYRYDQDRQRENNFDRRDWDREQRSEQNRRDNRNRDDQRRGDRRSDHNRR